MTLNTFFEKFALFADAPDAVGKMRELVLRLALHGGFSGDDSTLWKSAELGDLLEVQNGFAFKSSFFNEVRQGMPLIRIRDIASEDTQVYYSGEYRDEFIVRKGDLIIGMDGNFNIHRWKGVNALLNQRVCRLVDISPEIDQQFLFYFVQEHLDEIHRNTTYTTVKHISSKQIRAIEFPLPPLDEQKRIVAKVDELMALCDRLEAQQQEREQQHTALSRASLARFADAPNPANLQLLFHSSFPIPPSDLRKSILTLAVQGKLVAQDPKDESAEHSLARNDERRRDTARSDHRADEDNQALLSADDRWDIADTWAWRGLADLVLFVDYRGKTPAKLSSGVRLLTAKNVRKGQINLSPEEFLSESEYKTWMTRGFPKAGDVLFTTEAPMGNAAVVELTERFALAQRVICFQSYGALDTAFLVLQILSDQFQFILDKNGTGVTAKGIKASKLKQLPIAIPPLAEQRRIVAKVDQLMALVDALETQLSASRATAKNLLDALVAELTSGSQKAS
jgi:type I restriction enzyme S subunit